MPSPKIVLVAPPLQWADHLRLSFQPPLNLMVLQAYLRQAGHDVELLDVVAHRLTRADTIDRLAAAKPDLVGLPLYYASLPAACALVAELRPRSPGMRFVAGGPCLTMEPERMMREGGFDFGVIGEGEETLAELMGRMPAGSAWDAVPGLAWRCGDEVRINSRRARIDDLDRLPFLDFAPLDHEQYFAHQERVGIPRTIFLNSSRGCSSRCTYCCTPVLWPGKICRFSPERLVAEIAVHTQRFPGVQIGFCDDSFFADRAWLMRFLELVKPLGIEFQCIGRADQLTVDLIDALVEAGLRYLAFGVETGSSDRQRRLRKHLDLPRLGSIIAALANRKITTKCFFMLGFPDETLEEMAATINLAAALKRQGMTFFSFFPVTLYPGTELAGQFPEQPFHSGLDAHLPEIIRDDLEIGSQHAEVLRSPFNSTLTYQHLVDLFFHAHQKVERGESTCVADLARLAPMVPV
jgi:anaerobic magnesium-protoporphyrin IX monomethyl ester cyclase